LTFIAKREFFIPTFVTIILVVNTGYIVGVHIVVGATITRYSLGFKTLTTNIIPVGNTHYFAVLDIIFTVLAIGVIIP